MMASMRDWLKGPESDKGRTIVVHCKAGKGRSGTSACSYLISEEGWSVEDALTRFTSRRMRSGFGSGVSIPSQLRWVGYVDWWTRHGKVYIERQIEILEVHVWGLRDGVKVAVAGYVEEGKVIKMFHTFDRKERLVVDGETLNSATVSDHLNEKGLPLEDSNHHATPNSPSFLSSVSSKTAHEPGADAVIFRPETPIVLPTSDINIDFERRNKATYGLTMVTSVAHVWFNAFFESQKSSTTPADHGSAPVVTTDPPRPDTLPDSGVFEIDWDAMDGIKGSARKGTRALDRLAVVWRAIPETKQGLKIITEPSVGQPVQESKPADWKNANLKTAAESLGKDLGLRTESPSSANVSKASSTTDLSNTALAAAGGRSDSDSEAGVKPHGPDGEDHIPHTGYPAISISEPVPVDHTLSGVDHGERPAVDLGLEKMRSPIPDPGMRSASTQDLPDIPEQLR